MAKTIKVIMILITFAANTDALLATAQFPDIIIFEGKQYSLNSNPLEQYFKKFPDKRPREGSRSTGLWRGYIATFEIIDSTLYLKDVEISLPGNKWKSVLAEVFPNSERVKIDWLTGLLVLPHGELVEYVHMGYASTYENYILLEIREGQFKRAKRFAYKQYEEFKQRQFEEFKKTEEYKIQAERLIKEMEYSAELVEQFLRIYVISYSSMILTE